MIIHHHFFLKLGTYNFLMCPFSNPRYRKLHHEFILGSLPSEGKHQMYEYIAKTLESGAEPELLGLGIDVSVITRNGNKLQTWKYRVHTLFDYTVFLDYNKKEFGRVK